MWDLRLAGHWLSFLALRRHSWSSTKRRVPALPAVSPRPHPLTGERPWTSVFCVLGGPSRFSLQAFKTKRSIQNARMSCQDWYAVGMPTSKSGQLLVKMRLSKELCGDWDKMYRILRE